MLDLVASKRFKKNLAAFLKKHPDLKSIVQAKLWELQRNPRHTSLKLHALTGKLKGCHAISLTYEYRLVCYIEDNAIFLLAIGTHDEVY